MSKKLKVPKYAKLFLDAIPHLVCTDESGIYYLGCCGALNRADVCLGTVNYDKAYRLFGELFRPTVGYYWFGMPSKRNLPKRVAALKKAYRIAVRRHNAKGKK